MTTVVRRLVPAGILILAACGNPAHKAGPAALTACAENIRVIPGQVEGAAGHRFLVLTFNNVSMTTCLMVGYPKVDLVDDEEHVVEHVRHTLRAQTGLPTGVNRPQPVVLRGGKSASAIVEASALPQGDGPPCRDYALMVTPPGQHSAVPAGPARMPNCDIQVHPVVAGDLRNR
jgi:hypothetical protein